MRWDGVSRLCRSAIGLGDSPIGTLCSITALAAATVVATPIVAYLDHCLLRPSLIPDADRVVFAQVSEPANAEVPLTGVQVGVIRSLTAAFADVGAYAPAGSSWPEDIVTGRPVSWCFLETRALRVMAVRPFLGRIFNEAEERDGIRVAIISYELWRRAYAGKPEALGTYLGKAAGESYRIIGVMPRHFVFPMPVADAWIPFAPATRDNQLRVRRVLARLASGVPLQSARAAAEVALGHVSDLERPRVALATFDDTVSAAARVAAPLLIVGLFTSLAIAAAVLAHLLLLEAVRRRTECGIRMALGASRWQVRSRFVLRSFLIAGCAFALGTSVSFYVVRFGRIYELDASLLLTEWLDGRVLAEMAAACAAIAAIAATLAVLAHWSEDIPALLGSVRIGYRGRSAWIARVLMASQTACATVFVICAGVTWVSVVHLNAVSPGFTTDHLLTVAVASPQLARTLAEPAQSARLFQEIVRRARQIPGVEDSAVTSNLPIYSNGNRIPFRSVPSRSACETAEVRGVSSDYFRTIALPIVAGRALLQTDGVSGERVAVVNSTLARLCWPGQSPLGRMGGFGRESWKVVGVVGDVPMFGLRKPPVAELYVPIHEFALPFMHVLLRVSTKDPYSPLEAFRHAVASVDATARVSSARTVEDIIAAARAPLSLRATLLASVAICTLIIAVVGVYITTAFVCRQQRRNRAIRVALGASPRALVVRMGATIAAWSLPGVLLGAAAAYVAASSLAPVLFGVRPFEAWLYGGAVCAVFLVTAVAASLGGADVLDSDLLRILHAD